MTQNTWNLLIGKEDIVDNDTPTIQEAMEQASSSLQSESVEETPQSVEKQPSEAPQGQMETEQPKEKAALEQFDPEKIPTELKPLYKNLMKGFTEGRQKDREEVKKLKEELESMRKKETPQEQIPDRPLTPEEYIERKTNEVLHKKEVVSFRETALREYNELDPRVDNREGNEQYDPILDAVVGSQLDKLLDDHVKEHGSELGFDYKTHGKELLKEYDAYVQKKIDAYLEKQKDLAKKSERSLNRLHPKTSDSGTKPSGNMSLEDAMAQAFSMSGNK